MLQSDGRPEDVDLTRSWMLPVFRDHIQDTQIAFFAEYFLPLASQLKLKCETICHRVCVTINTFARRVNMLVRCIQ